MRIIDFSSLLSIDEINQALSIERYSSRKLSDSSLSRLTKDKLTALIHTEFPLVTTEDYATKDVLFFKSIGRSDYDSLYSAVVAAVPSALTKSIDVPFRIGRRPNVQIMDLVSRCKPMARNIDGRSDAEVTYLFIRLCFYLLTVDYVLRHRFRKLVVFADMQPIDFLLCCICRRLGRPSATMQHGLYVDYQSLDNVNRVNYLNHSADVFMAWGRVTEQLILKYHPQAKVAVTGHPLAEKGAHTDRLHSRISTLLVILDQPIFDEQNQQLIRYASAVAKNKGLRLFVRPHPNTDITKFKQVSEAMLTFGGIAPDTLYIGHTSTLLYEMLFAGAPIARYKTHVPALELGDNVTFADESELLKILSDQQVCMQDNRIIESQLIGAYGEDSLLLYRKCIEDLS